MDSVDRRMRPEDSPYVRRRRESISRGRASSAASSFRDGMDSVERHRPQTVPVLSEPKDADVRPPPETVPNIKVPFRLSRWQKLPIDSDFREEIVAEHRRSSSEQWAPPRQEELPPRPVTRSSIPPGWSMPREFEQECDRFDQRHGNLFQKTHTVLSQLESDSTSAKAERSFQRDLAEIRTHRLPVQPLRWRSADTGGAGRPPWEVGGDPLANGGFSGSRNPRSAPRGRPPRVKVANPDVMSADELSAAEARLAELKRRAAAGELTDEERAEMEALEKKLAAHHKAAMMSPDELDAAEARLAELKRRAAAGELTDEERKEMEALERKLAAHHKAIRGALMSADELNAAEARLAELKRRAAAGELTDEERAEMEALEKKLAAHHKAANAAMMSADELDEAEARLAELKRRAAAGELTDEERREMEALERKLAAHHQAAAAKGIMSADEVDAAEARLAELKRRAAAGELTDEERAEMEALERKLAAHHKASEAEAAKAAAKGGGKGGKGNKRGGGSGGGADGALDDGPPEWLKKSKIFGSRCQGGSGLYDSQETLIASLEHDWGWAKQNNLEQYIAKADGDGKTDPDGANARVKAVLQEVYNMLLSVYYYYASATADLDVYTIGPNEYNMMLVELDLPVPGSADCAKQHLESIFIAVDSGQKTKEAFNAKHALSRQEFLQVMIRIAVHRYVKPRKRGAAPLLTDVSEAVRELLSVHIEPRVDPAALQVSNDFREKLVYIEETNEVLSDKVETLQALYEVYSGKSHGMDDLTSDSKMLGIDEWLELCADLQLIDDEFTLREARLCFLWSRLRVADESDASQRRSMCNLRFEDFCECLVRLATMKRMPTDAEVDEAGYADGGDMILGLRKTAQLRDWCATRQQAWNDELPQPIGRCVSHLLATFIRTVEDRLLREDEPTTGVGLTKKMVTTFKNRVQKSGG